MQPSPLQRAEIQVVAPRRLSSPAIVTGLVREPRVELAPGATMILPAAGEQPASGESTIFIPPTTEPPIRALRESENTLRLTESELSALGPGEPVVVASASRVVRMPAFEVVAGQAADAGRTLVIVVLADDDE